MSIARILLGTKLLSLATIVILLVSCAGGAPAAPSPTATSVAPAKSAAATPAAKTPATSPSPAAKAEDKPQNAPVSLKLGVVAGLSDAGLFIANDKGYFKEQGLNVEIVNFDTAAKMIPMMATGQLEVGTGATSAGLFNAYKREIPIKIVADKGSTPKGHGFAALVIRKDLIDNGTIKDYADLRGKTMAVSSTGSTPAIELDKALQKGNIKFEDMKIVEMAFPDMAAAFANKSIDGAIQIEPTLTQVVEKGLTVRWKGVDELYPDSQVAVIMYAPTFMQNQPDAAKRFMVAYVKALRDYNDAFSKNKGKAEIVSILAKNTPVKDIAVYDKMAPVGLNPDGAVNKESIASDQDWFAAHGMVNQKVDINELVDSQFVEYALQKLGKYQ